MGLRPGITLVTACYGDYWERFSEQWIAAIEATDPQPDSVVLATDVQRPVPSWCVEVVLGKGLHMADYFNSGVGCASTEWVMCIGFDDAVLPGAFEPFETEADCYLFPMVFGGAMEGNGLARYLGGFEQMPNNMHNPMAGGFLHRTSLLREMPFRRMSYFDWAHFSEMAYFGKTVEDSPTPRAVWVRHGTAHAIAPRPDYHAEVYAFNERLKAGLVQMGVPENKES